jgi:hypothetical protein
MIIDHSHVDETLATTPDGHPPPRTRTITYFDRFGVTFGRGPAHGLCPRARFAGRTEDSIDSLSR